jgi:hypothetical protein
VARVLITGMTAPQSSRRLNSRSLAFAGALSGIIESAKHRVEWAEPSVNVSKEDLAGYDVILIGIAPVLSVTSNKAYGVLWMLNELRDDPRVRYFVDTPEPTRITANLRAVEKDFDSLVKPFYSQRKQYREVESSDSIKSAIASSVSHLLSSEWPTTLYPATPWADDGYVINRLPLGAAASVVGIQVDSFYVAESLNRVNSDKVKRWSIDSDKTKWAKSTISSLQYPHVAMKKNRGSTDDAVFVEIARSVGSLLSPTVDGAVWWSHRIAQSLNAGTPVASDWRVTSRVGGSWSHLAAGIEEMSYIDMYELSASQKSEYIDSLPSRDTVKEIIETSLGIQR